MKYLIYFLFLFVSVFISAQSTFQPLDKINYHKLDRIEINNHEFNQNYHSSVKPYQRSAIVSALQQSDTARFTKIDEANRTYFYLDNTEWSEADASSNKPFLKHFYRNKHDFFHHSEKDFDLHVNPVLLLQAGKDSDSKHNSYINTRGVELRGSIDNKVGFYTYFSENQVLFPSFATKRIYEYGAVPGENFWKSYSDGKGVDFFTTRGYITWNFTKHINAQFGHDKHFIGDGYRSLILSDYGGNYTFLKLSTNIWKLNYTNIFAELHSDVFRSKGNVPKDGNYPKKYMAFHHLSANIGKKLNIGVFESIIYAGADSVSSANFEISYLNPVIFYRNIEQNLGSAGNAMLGLNYKWMPVRKVQLYGQFVLDEMNVQMLKKDNTWWGNKFGVQLGLKYIDAFTIKNLDLLLETNTVRPYTYGHSSQANYSHYRQPLAHPQGANFKEYIFQAAYQATPRWFLLGKMIYTNLGKDQDQSHYGQNILLSYRDRTLNFGSKTGQGVSTQIYYTDLLISYMLKPNFYIETHAIFRREKSEISSLSYNNNYISAGIRWNISQRLMDY